MEDVFIVVFSGGVWNEIGIGRMVLVSWRHLLSEIRFPKERRQNVNLLICSRLAGVGWFQESAKKLVW